MSDLSFSCPVCGADVPRKAKSCPDCGACEKSGWSNDSYLDGLDLPDQDYTTGEPLTPRGQSNETSVMQKFWWVIAVLVLLAFLWMTFSRVG